MKLNTAAVSVAFATLASVSALGLSGPVLAQAAGTATSASQAGTAGAPTAASPVTSTPATPAPAPAAETTSSLAAAGAATTTVPAATGSETAASAAGSSATPATTPSSTALSPSKAVTQPPLPASSTNMMGVVTGLGLVLALLIGATYFLKRMTASRAGAHANIRIVGGVSVGNRERVMVVEVADQWIVVGVAAGSVRSLATMPRQVPTVRTGGEDNAPAPGAANFSSWLTKKIDQRNGRS